jgi:hypothetical protein
MTRAKSRNLRSSRFTGIAFTTSSKVANRAAIRYDTLNYSIFQFILQVVLES